MSNKIRLDLLLVQRGLVESREKAQALIRAGSVRIADQPVTKPGHTYPDDTEVEVEQPPQFVGRGGEKLVAALDTFSIPIESRVAIDVGASTGGFTDCLLQHGARHVYAVDVGKGQLHWSLRQDERVTPIEGLNARHLEPDLFEHKPDLAVVDVSFISLTKILPALSRVLQSGHDVITLIKPQFEAGREQVGKGGVVKDPRVHQEVQRRIRAFGEEEMGWNWQAVCRSPITGPAGNVEFLAWWKVA